MNQFVFRVTRPGDKLHKPFLSTWIHGRNEAEAKSILSRTYKKDSGFKLTMVYDLEGDKAKAQLVKFSNLSLTSAQI